MKFEAKPRANPMGALQRTSERLLTSSPGRMPVSLAETPMRDGPFAPSAVDVALNKPPRTRAKRADMGNWPFSGPLKLKYAKAGRPPEDDR